MFVCFVSCLFLCVDFVFFGGGGCCFLYLLFCLFVLFVCLGGCCFCFSSFFPMPLLRSQINLQFAVSFAY